MTSITLLLALIAIAGIARLISPSVTSMHVIPFMLIGFIAVITRHYFNGLRLVSVARSERNEYEMTKGSVTKLVNTFGSRWGRIRPNLESRDVFFNSASLDKSVEFASLSEGQAVEFNEIPDHINGSHAEQIVMAPESPADRKAD